MTTTEDKQEVRSPVDEEALIAIANMTKDQARLVINDAMMGQMDQPWTAISGVLSGLEWAASDAGIAYVKRFREVSEEEESELRERFYEVIGKSLYNISLLACDIVNEDNKNTP